MSFLQGLEKVQRDTRYPSFAFGNSMYLYVLGY